VSDVQRPPAEPPGWGKIAIMAGLTVWFAVKTARWWAAVAAGTTTMDGMTTWGWVKIVFYHVAVIVGLGGIGEMVRLRRRSPGPEPAPAPESGGPG
jgi:hypothetical protein